uniref:Uncharacterized protein n=1 Tax=Timema genevievae TaxID=629358 RepID=A0A7R9JZ88_TIMGE|nr:unnamed protein product [Timema genevievae]
MFQGKACDETTPELSNGSARRQHRATPTPRTTWPLDILRATGRVWREGKFNPALIDSQTSKGLHGKGKFNTALIDSQTSKGLHGEGKFNTALIDSQNSKGLHGEGKFNPALIDSQTSKGLHGKGKFNTALIDYQTSKGLHGKGKFNTALIDSQTSKGLHGKGMRNVEFRGIVPVRVDNYLGKPTLIATDWYRTPISLSSPEEAHGYIKHAAKHGVAEAKHVLREICSQGHCDM